MLKKASLVALILALLLVLPMLGSCSKKIAITDTEFTDLTQKAGYTVTDGTGDVNRFDTKDVTVSKQAADPDNKFTIEFYEFSSAETTLTAAKAIDKTLNALPGVVTLSIHSTNSYWRGTNDNTFYFYSRVDNTIIYAQTEDTNKDALSEMLKTLGYW